MTLKSSQPRGTISLPRSLSGKTWFVIRRTIPLIILLALGFSTCFAQPDVKQDLNGIASIAFPQKPQVQDNKIGKYFYVLSPTDYYFVQVRDVSKTPNFNIKQGDLDSLYNGLIHGTVMAMQGGKLLSQGKFKVGTLEGAESRYQFDTRTKVRRFVYQRVLFVNNTILNYSFWTTADSLAQTAQKRDHFFNSLAIITKDDLEQYNYSDSLWYRLSYVIKRYWILFISILAVGGIAVFVITRLNNRTPTDKS